MYDNFSLAPPKPSVQAALAYGSMGVTPSESYLAAVDDGMTVEQRRRSPNALRALRFMRVLRSAPGNELVGMAIAELMGLPVAATPLAEPSPAYGSNEIERHRMH